MFDRIIGSVVVSEFNVRTNVVDAKRNVEVFLSLIKPESVPEKFKFMFGAITKRYLDSSSILDADMYYEILELGAMSDDDYSKEKRLYDSVCTYAIHPEKYASSIRSYLNSTMSAGLSDVMIKATMALETGFQDEDLVLYKGFDGAKEILMSHLLSVDNTYSADAPSAILNNDAEGIAKEYDDTQNGIIQAGVKCGINAIDRETGGFQPGDLVMICGFSGHGKCIDLETYIYVPSRHSYVKLKHLYNTPGECKKYSSILGYDKEKKGMNVGIGEIVKVGKKPMVTLSTAYDTIHPSLEHKFLVKDESGEVKYKKAGWITTRDFIAMPASLPTGIVSSFDPNLLRLLGFWFGNPAYKGGELHLKHREHKENWNNKLEDMYVDSLVKMGVPRQIIHIKKVNKEYVIDFSLTDAKEYFDGKLPANWVAHHKRTNRERPAKLTKTFYEFYGVNTKDKELPLVLKSMTKPLLREFVKYFVSTRMVQSYDGQSLGIAISQEKLRMEFKSILSKIGYNGMENAYMECNGKRRLYGFNLDVLWIDRSAKFFKELELYEFRPDILVRALVDIEPEHVSENGQLMFARVINRKLSGEAECGDIIDSTVGNSFVAHGMVVHNSQTLNNVVHHMATVERKNVCVITSETIFKTFRRRFFTRHSAVVNGGLPLLYNEIKFATLSPEDKDVFANTIKDFTTNPKYGKVYIAQAPVGCTVQEAYVLAAQINAVFQVHVLGLDSIELMNPTRRRSSRREEIDEMLAQAKGMAIGFDHGRGVILLNTHQVKDEEWKRCKPEEGKFYTRNSLAETSNAHKKADVIICLYSNELLDEQNEMAMKAVKVRDSGETPLFRVYKDWSRSYLGNLE